jgi:hypothetical protein
MSSSLSLELRAGLGTRLASPLADVALVVVSMNDDSVAIAVDGGR